MVLRTREIIMDTTNMSLKEENPYCYVGERDEKVLSCKKNEALLYIDSGYPKTEEKEEKEAVFFDDEIRRTPLKESIGFENVNENYEELEQINMPGTEEEKTTNDGLNGVTPNDTTTELFEKQKTHEFSIESILTSNNLPSTRTIDTENYELSADDRVLRDLINKLISPEAIASIPTPLQENSCNIDCEIPVDNLMKDFPFLSKYMERNNQQQDDQDGDGNTINVMSPTSLSYAMMSISRYNNNCTTNESISQDYSNIFKSPIPPMEIKTEKSSSGCYPGSMLNNNDIENGFDLESYLSGNSNDGNGNEDYMQTNEGSNYVQEVLDHYQQNGWSPSGNNNNNNNFMGGNSNILQPVMLSYDEIDQLQQLQSASGTGMSPYILPIFLQPFMVPNKKKGNQKVKSNSRNTIKNEMLNSKTNNIDYSKISPDTAVNPNTWENQPKNGSNPMKYLGEAAVRLLQSEKKNSISKAKGGEEGKHKCLDCGRSFNRLYTLSTHQRIHTGEKPYVCEICGIGFRQSGTKLNHIRAVHTKERPFECPYCGKTFSHKSSITVHIRIHTNEKPYQCEHCTRRFTDRATYLKHQSIHSGIKPYRCPVCTKCFSQKSNLKRHFKNIHQETRPNAINAANEESNSAPVYLRS